MFPQRVSFINYLDSLTREQQSLLDQSGISDLNRTNIDMNDSQLMNESLINSENSDHSSSDSEDEISNIIENNTHDLQR